MKFVATYHDLIDGLLQAAGESDKMMHMHAGMAIFLVSQVAFRDRRASHKALLMVFMAESANEMMDRLYWGSWRWSDTIGDLVATLFWPSMIVAVTMFRRARWHAAAKVRIVRKRIGLKPRPTFAA